jgi:hypothetical protein
LFIGPVILEDRITGQNYLEFLKDELPEQLENVPLAARIAMHSQHDGAPPHYTRLVMQHLNDTFLNWWISRGSTINWPPRSQNFCLWGWMKNEVYRRKEDTWEQLLDRIMDAIAHIKERQDELRRATRHALTRVAKCTDVDCGIFENVL